MEERFWRLFLFLGGLGLLALLERALPAEPLSARLSLRWRVNLALAVINALFTNLLCATCLLRASLFAEQKGWGLLRTVQRSTAPLVFLLLVVVLLDLSTFLWHAANHRFPFLWRFHLVHHTDRDLDVTSASRFHPGEIVLSTAYKAGLILSLGIPMEAVTTFEAVLLLATQFQHSRLRLPKRIDGLVRLVTVSPAMHRLHHSVEVSETNSNYGTILTFWDRLFGTLNLRTPYTPPTVGLPRYSDPEGLGLTRVLSLPVRSR